MTQFRGNEDVYFLRNPVEAPTENNDTKLALFSKDHFAKVENEYLKNPKEETIKSIYEALKKAHHDFLSNMKIINAKEKIYAVYTEEMNKQLTELTGQSGVLSIWEATFLSLYRKDRKKLAQVMKLVFPRGRDPFSNTKKDMIIEEVGAVAAAYLEFINTYVKEEVTDSPEMELYQEMQEYYEALKEYRKTQQGKEKEAAEARENKRLSREVLVNLLHKNILQLMLYFWPNKRRVLDFIEVSYLRKKRQKGKSTKEEEDIFKEIEDRADEIKDMEE